MKFDGYRLVAGAEGGNVHLATRGGYGATNWFPEVVDGLAAIPGGPHVFDGQVCVLDDLGRSDFDRLQTRARRRRWYPGCDPAVFCAFDLLARDGRDLMNDPVEERQAHLADVVARAGHSVLYVGHFDSEHGRRLYKHAKELRL